ncbi:MAG: O-antigen ligase family protein, partial [Planctomycetes bacterium]|nr:O-antigen ligase family protein [Planctomycetota bacterium]
LGIWGSGSRKAIVSLILFYPLWIWFCYRKEVARKPALLIFVAMALTAGAAAFTVGVKGSATGDRLAETWEFVTGQRSKGGGSERLVLYSEAIRVFAENPVVGIGMGQFVYVNRTHHMSHSDIMEVAAGSGLPGVILYLSIIVVFWRRCGRIAGWSSDPDEVRLARLFRVCVVVLFLIALGRTNSGSKTHWVFMASLIGYTATVHRRLLGGEQGGPVLTPRMESWHEYSSVGQFQPATPPAGRRNT